MKFFPTSIFTIFLLLTKLSFSQEILNELPRYTTANKVYIVNDIDAQGIDFLDLSSAKDPYNAITITFGEGLIYIIFDSNDWCEKIMITVPLTDSGAEFKRNYYNFLNENYLRLNDGSWKVKFTNEKNVRIIYDSKLLSYIFTNY